MNQLWAQLEKGTVKMKYFKTWQDALMYFLESEGVLYDDGFDLVSSFEQKLYKNSKGVYFMYTGNKEN